MADFPVVLGLVHPRLAVVSKKLQSLVDGMLEHIGVGHVGGQVGWLAAQVDHVLPPDALVRPPGWPRLRVAVDRVVSRLLVTQQLR